jgi:hypothetical protein
VADILGMVSRYVNIELINVMDIGTEDSLFLRTLEKKLHNNGHGMCGCIGLNIASDKFPHYGQFNETVKSGLIQLYDGTNFNFKENEISLTTIIAVLHHVENIEDFMKNLAVVTQYIYIKDNDMIDANVKALVDIQHNTYEGVFYPSKESFIRYMTLQNAVDLLEANGFDIIHKKVYDGFTRPYSLIAKKRSTIVFPYSIRHNYPGNAFDSLPKDDDARSCAIIGEALDCIGLANVDLVHHILTTTQYPPGLIKMMAESKKSRAIEHIARIYNYLNPPKDYPMTNYPPLGDYTKEEKIKARTSIRSFTDIEKYRNVLQSISYEYVLLVKASDSIIKGDVNEAIYYSLLLFSCTPSLFQDLAIVEPPSSISLNRLLEKKYLIFYVLIRVNRMIPKPINPPQAIVQSVTLPQVLDNDCLNESEITKEMDDYLKKN